MKNKFLLCSLVFLLLISIVSTNANQNITKFSTFEGSSLIDTMNIDNSSEEKIDVIVNFKEKIDENLLRENDIEVKENLRSIEVSTVKASAEAIEEIQKDINVESVELDLDLELFGEGNPVSLNEQIIPWGIERVDAPTVWNELTGKNIKIAVIDSGLNKNHLDLKGNIFGGVSFVNGSGYWEDDLGHGTSVAGVISALDNDIGVVGVAPRSEIYSVKVIGLSGGKLSNFIQGIQWAIDNDMDVVVMSLGIPVDSPSLRKIVDEAYLNGVILVAGSGKNNEIYYPAKYSSVIAVGSIDENNELTNENGNGEELEFVAPGKNIISTSSEGYGSFDGTSMAAPHVAGVIALLKENDPSLNPNEIRGKLQRSAIDLGSSGKDSYFGYGLVNVNLEEENLDATIQIIFPEELNETKKEEYEINPVRIEIIKIDGENEEIVQTLFYDGNKGTQNISVEAGNYKINQYFDDEIYSNNYVVNEGEIVVIPLHKTNPPVHQWIAWQASKIWVTPEIQNYIDKNNYDDSLDSSGYSSDEGVLIGAGEEDEDETDPIDCGGSVYPYTKPFCWHFWDPDIPQGGQYNAGWTDSLYNTQYGSSYTKAQNLWSNKVIYYYENGEKAKSYYWLGRVAHLLEDAAVPAHVHDDTHAVDDDEYEDFFSDYTNSWSDGKSNYKHFVGSSYSNQFYKYENINLPSGVKTNPSDLFKLFWYTAQKTQYYASDDVLGNSNYKKETGSSLYSFSPSLWNGESVTIISDPDDLEDFWGYGDIDNLKLESEALIPHSMKSVSGLYRLFWAETHDLVACTSGKCCDTSLTLTKEKWQQPTGLSDYYFVSGTNSPTGTSYIKLKDYYCLGSSSTETYSDTTTDTCGICKYGNNGASSCSNYDLSTIYNSNTKCSMKGANGYDLNGEYLCQDLCNGVGNRGYAGNCVFSIECASQYDIEPISYVNLSTPNNILLGTESSVDVNLNKMAKDMQISLDENTTLFNCTECQGFSSNLTNLTEGEHKLDVYVEDYAENTKLDSTKFYVDTRDPVIHESWPSNGTKVPLTVINFGMNYSEENVGTISFAYKLPEDSDFKNMIIVDLEYPHGDNQSYTIPINLSQIFNGTSGQLDFFFRVIDVTNKEANSSIKSLEVVDCMPNWILEEDWSECTFSDLRYQDWSDTNECGLDYSKPERNSSSCDYCLPNWTATQECKEDDSLLINYTDGNGCYVLTNLESDLENKPNNTIEQFSCDYNHDGFIGDLSNMNTSIENITKEQINNTIMFKENDNTLLEFDFNLTEGKINLADLSIEKQSNESTFAYMLIRGLDLTSQNKTKTAYLDKILGGTGLCIKDEEFSSISEVSSECNGENETWIACPGIIGDYSCNLTSNETQYVITGLKHSGVKEQSTFCGDNVCNGAESCSVCSLDCGGCPPSGGGGGGGGGGGSGGGGGGGSVSTVNKQVVNNETIPSGGDNGSEGNETFAPTGENPVQDQPRSVWQRVVNFFRGGSPTNPSITGAVVGAGEGSGGRNSFMLIALVVVLGIAGILIWHKQKKKKLVEKANSKE